MTLDRRTAFSALAVLSFTASLTTVFMSSTPALADGAQYCIARGGVNGDSSYVGNCIYSDYQQCVLAAADARGNCVGNVEYRGAPAVTSAPRRMRGTR